MPVTAKPVKGTQMPGTPTSNTVYEAVEGWAKIPHGLYLREATAVAVDGDDHVYIFSRGNMPVMVFDRDGNMIDCWGNDDPYTGTVDIIDPYGNPMVTWPGNRFMWAHAIRVDHEENLYLVDVVDNKIHKTTKSGRELMVIGTGVASEAQGGDPFNRPTDVTVDPASGDVFISDGYKNSRVHRFDPKGNLKFSWGTRGATTGSSACRTASPCSARTASSSATERIIACRRSRSTGSTGRPGTSITPSRSGRAAAKIAASTWPNRGHHRFSGALRTSVTGSPSITSMESS